MNILNKKLGALLNANASNSDTGRRNFLRKMTATPLGLAAGSAALPMLLSEQAIAQPKPSPYGTKERDFRWNNLKDFMSKNGLDCMILPKGRGNGLNSFQYADYYSNAPFMNPGAVIFPLKGEPAIIGSIPVPGAWITKTVSKWTPTGDQPPLGDHIVNFVKEMGYEKGNIGVVGTEPNVHGLNEFNNEGLVTYATWARVLKGLPKAKIEDVTGSLADVMMVKSDEEIENTIKASLLGERLHESWLENVHVGMDSLDFHLAVSEFMMRNGADTDVEALYLPPGKIHNGFVMNTEYGIRYQGGYAQVTLCLACGKVDKEVEKLAEKAHEVMDYGQKHLVPGVRFGDVVEHMQTMITDAGYWHFVPVIHGLPMHAIGTVCMGEPPKGPCSMIRGADMIIKPGMAFTFEPTAQIGPSGPMQKSVKVGGMAVTTKDGLNMINTLGLRMQRVS